MISAKERGIKARELNGVEVYHETLLKSFGSL